MARLKIYTAAEHRYSYLSQAIADAVGTGPHCQGDFYVAAHTKAAAITRLAELGMRYTPGKLRVADAERDGRRIRGLLTLPGDFTAWHATARLDVPIVRIRYGETEPTVAAHWRANPNHGKRAYPGVPAYMIRFLSEEDHTA